MFDDPAQLPRHCPMRTDPARPRRLLAAVLRVADGDRLAQRTLLQLADRLQAQARHTG